MKNGIKSLEKVNYKVDYMITHCCPTSIQTLLNPSYEKDILTDYLQEYQKNMNLKSGILDIIMIIGKLIHNLH